MRRFQTWFTVGMLLLGAAATARAQTLNPAALRQSRHTQEQVREMARSLIVRVLDIQLQQLRENQLDAHPWYGEIETMRRNVDDLIADKPGSLMSEVLATLDRLETAEEAQHETIFLEARQQTRMILARLYVERRRLAHRLQIAEIAAQVRRLIELQTETLDDTESLPEQPDSRRNALNVATIEDQRDIKALYGKFTEALVLVSEADWDGPFPAEAKRGLELLAEGKVEPELDAAERHLRAPDFFEAAASQKTVILGLKALLERIELAQGMADVVRAETIAKISEMIGRQQEVSEATQQADSDTSELAEQQSEIAQDIGELSQSTQIESAQQSLQDAQQAANEAAADLLNPNPQQALAQQENVVQDLRQAAGQLSQEQIGDDRPIDWNSENALAEALEPIAQQRQAVEDAREKVAEAQASQEEAAGRPAAAEAMRLAERIREALQQQTEADIAAAKTESGWGNVEEAVEKQQQVAEAAGEIAEDIAQAEAEQAGGEEAGGEQAGGEQAGGEQAGGEQAGGEQASGEQAGGMEAGGEQAGGEQAGGEQAGGEQA
ncbi:MAG: hypothetical protein HQ581_27865, partial [Planctomycetes bacterium]|nr:hypothetical protein [Planctomycetota bacterium]